METAESRYKEIGLAAVSGTITFNGSPLASAQICFEENGSFAYGVSDKNGRYHLWTDTYHTGCMPGVKTVRIWTTLRGPGFNELLAENGANTPAGKEIIPVHYNKESTLSATIEKNGSHTFNFDLQPGGKTANALQLGEEETVIEKQQR
jgi:hypothetical protein